MVEYWDAAARVNPYGAICTNATAKNFEFRSSVVYHPSVLLTKEMVVLELGCGIGRVTSYVAEKVCRYMGVDYSKNMVAAARSRHRNKANVFFIKNDGWSLKEISDNSVDLVFSELTFQHMHKFNALSYIKEAHRVLKPQGIFLAQIPRLDYYNFIDAEGEVYALTKEETISFFSIFDRTEFLPYDFDYAYFLVRGVK